MKFVRFIPKREDGAETPIYGLLREEDVYEIKGDIFGIHEVTDTRYALSEVKLAPPCTPTKIVAVGINYRDHAKEMHHDLPEDPVIFMKPTTALIGQEDTMRLPSMSEKVDYEGELALIIGKTAKNVKPEEAHHYIFGVSCLNDVTARDLQKKDGQWTRAKSFDTFAPFGPCIVTGLDYNNLDIELVLNGETRQKSNTSYFINNGDRIVSYISQIMTLNPGDVIATGTPAGVGKLSAGDVVEVRIEGIGILRNNVK